jgi:endo-1,4-beta-xylanase
MGGIESAAPARASGRGDAPRRGRAGCHVIVSVALLSAALRANAAEPPSLKELAPRGLLIGAAVNQAQSDGKDAAATAIVTRQFNTISPENLLKWESVHPESGRYVFEPADRYVSYGRERGMAVIGHVLLWHQQTPAWVFAGKDGKPPDRELLLGRLREHIQTVVGRYRGRIHGWDVVNEAFEDDGSWRKTPWLDAIGQDYVAKAFEFARAADPQAELYYNDYNLWKPAKRKAAIALVGQLRAQGLRVDAIGEQGHWGVADPPLADVLAMLSDFAAAGQKIVITELDMDVLPRDPEMWGADLAKKVKIRAATNVYPNGLPGRAAARSRDVGRRPRQEGEDPGGHQRLPERPPRGQAAGARAALCGPLRSRAEVPDHRHADHVLGRDGRAVVAPRFPDPRPGELPVALGSGGTAQARLRGGGRRPARRQAGSAVGRPGARARAATRGRPRNRLVDAGHRPCSTQVEQGRRAVKAAINAKELRGSLPRVVEQVRKGARFTVIYRSRPAFRIVPLEDARELRTPLASDPLFRAGAVGRSSDGRSARDHDETLYRP